MLILYGESLLPYVWNFSALPRGRLLQLMLRPSCCSGRNRGCSGRNRGWSNSLLFVGSFYCLQKLRHACTTRPAATQQALLYSCSDCLTNGQSSSLTLCGFASCCLRILWCTLGTFALCSVSIVAFCLLPVLRETLFIQSRSKYCTKLVLDLQHYL